MHAGETNGASLSLSPSSRESTPRPAPSPLSRSVNPSVLLYYIFASLSPLAVSKASGTTQYLAITVVCL